MLRFDINKWDKLIKFPGKIVASKTQEKEDDTYIILDAFIEDGVPIALGTNNWGTISLYAILTKKELDNFTKNHKISNLDPNHEIIFPEVLIDERVYSSNYMMRFREALYNYSNIDEVSQDLELKGKYLVGWDFQHNMDIKERYFLDKLWEVIKASNVNPVHSEIYERDKEIYREYSNREDNGTTIIIHDLYLNSWLSRLIKTIHP